MQNSIETTQRNLIHSQDEEIQQLRDYVNQLHHELVVVTQENDSLRKKLEEEKRYSKFMFDEAWNQTYNVIEILENS